MYITKLGAVVLSSNTRARDFLTKHGFVLEGHDSQLMFIDGEYVDGERYGKII